MISFTFPERYRRYCLGTETYKARLGRRVKAMGKETIINEVKKQAKIMIGAGLVGFLGAGGFALYNFMNGNFSSLVLLCALISLIGLVCAGIGIHDLISPEKSFTIRSNPEIYDMTDDHSSNVIYQDEYLIVSDKMISIANKPDTVSYRNEVYLVYIDKDRLNFSTVGKAVVVETARGSHRIDVLKESDASAEEKIFPVFARYCPNAVFGYSRENMDYLERSRQSWRQANGS